MNDLTAHDVALALKRFGIYRVRRTITVCRQHGASVITGPIVISLGLRETLLRNIEGGAKWDEETRRWVVQDDPTLMDVGCFQISRLYNGAALKQMAGVRVGTWTPVIDGHTANDKGFAPRFEDSVQFTVSSMHEALEYAIDAGVPADGSRRAVAIAAHNAGPQGALAGYRAGNIDKNTAGGDYSAWVLRHAKMVNAWLDAHPNWRP